MMNCANLRRPARPGRRRPLAAAAGLALALGAAAPAWAQAQPEAAAASSAEAERAALEALRATTLGLIQALVDQGLLSSARADALVRQATARAATPAPPPTAAGAAPATPTEPGWGRPAAGTVRVPYVPEAVRAQLRQEITQEVLAAQRAEQSMLGRPPGEWLKSISVEGDVRVRGQRELFDDGNLPPEVYRAQVSGPAWAPDLANTLITRDRMTVRARLGVNARVSDAVSAGLRLGTGNSPSSASQTLGNQFNRFNATIDRAFVRWRPLDWMAIEGGRMANPWFGSDLLWPDDLALDGVALRLDAPWDESLRGFATAGAMPLEEFATTTLDKWLYGVQVGAAWAPSAAWDLRAAVAMYDFQNIEGVRATELPPTGALAGTVAYQASQYPAAVRAKGNTLINLNASGSVATPVWGLASRFKPLNATIALNWRPGAGQQVSLNLDWVRNTGFDLADIRQRAGVDSVNSLLEKTSGYQARLVYGTQRLAEPGDWQVSTAWRQFERDAWVDAFTDTTWHLGGTNYRGVSVGASYALDKRSVLALRWTSTRNLDDGQRFLAIPGDPSSVSGNLSSAPLKIDVLQVDATVRF